MRPCIQRRSPVRRSCRCARTRRARRLRALQDRPQERRDVGRQHLERRLAVDLVLRPAHPVRERLVDERVRERRGRGRRSGPECCRRTAAAATSCALSASRIADVVLDVGHHRERAADAAAQLAIREQRDAHPAQLAARPAARGARRRRSPRRTRARCSPASRRTRRRTGRRAARGRAHRPAVTPIQSPNGLLAKRTLSCRSK